MYIEGLTWEFVPIQQQAAGGKKDVSTMSMDDLAASGVQVS
jgi:hypothetical protein